MFEQDDIVDWEGLTYYDKKIKSYITEKTANIETTVAELSATVDSVVKVEDLVEIDNRIDSLAETSASTVANVTALQEDRDDLEAAVLVLQADDKATREDIADLRVALENTVKEQDVANLASKSDLQDVVVMIKTEYATPQDVEEILVEKVTNGELSVNKITYGSF